MPQHIIYLNFSSVANFNSLNYWHLLFIYFSLFSINFFCVSSSCNAILVLIDFAVIFLTFFLLFCFFFRWCLPLVFAPTTTGSLITTTALLPRTNWTRSSTSSEYVPSSTGGYHSLVTTSSSHPMTASVPSLGSAPPSRMGSLRRTAIPTVTSHRVPQPPPQSRQYQDSPDGSYRSATASPQAGGVGFRSNSAIDVHAARRAQARAQYANANRLKIGSGVSLRKY